MIAHLWCADAACGITVNQLRRTRHRTIEIDNAARGSSCHRFKRPETVSHFSTNADGRADIGGDERVFGACSALDRRAISEPLDRYRPQTVGIGEISGHQESVTAAGRGRAAAGA